MNQSLGRRSLLLGGSAMLLAGCGIAEGSSSSGRIISGRFDSAAMGGARTGWSISYPKGYRPGDHLPVVISLHGRGGDHSTSFRRLHLDVAQEFAIAELPRSAFAVASVDGGNHSYWHPRADGTDAGRMLREEFVALLADHGLDTERLGLYGWSMGGFGALLQAGKYRMPVRAVSVSSPALFTSAGATPQGAFDDAEDFRRNDVFGHPEWLAGRRVRLDCGLQDPFLSATKSFDRKLEQVLGRPPASSYNKGSHTSSYWSAAARQDMLYLASQLTRLHDPHSSPRG